MSAERRALFAGLRERYGRAERSTRQGDAARSRARLARVHRLHGRIRGLHNLGDEGFIHRRIRHAEKVYVSGDVHANTIDATTSVTRRVRSSQCFFAARRFVDFLSGVAAFFRFPKKSLA